MSNGFRTKSTKRSKDIQVKGALPDLKNCVLNDKDGDVRGECRHDYYVICGKMPVAFNQKDVVYFERQFVAPRVIEFYSKLSDNDPDKKEHLALEQSLKEFKMRNSKGDAAS